MERKELELLEKVNQLALTDEERDAVLSFFTKQADALQILAAVETDNVERMVHVNPISVGIREDVAIKLFTREELQQSAPETTDGYWQVPRLVE